MPEPTENPPIITAPERPGVLMALLAPLIGIAMGVFLILPVFGAAEGLHLADVDWGQLSSSPSGFMIALVVVFLGFAMTAVGLALLGASHWVPRLGLVRPKLPLWGWPLLLGANLFLWWSVSMGMEWLVQRLGIEVSEHLQTLDDLVMGTTGKARFALLFCVAVLPAVGEELIIRGYTQRRLVRRWGAPLGVFLSSMIFALIHGDPQHMLLIFPLGLWWSFVAWKTGSTFSSMVLHLANNAWAIGFAWLVTDWAMDHPTTAETAMIAFISITAPCFIAAIIMLLRQPAPNHASA